MCTIIQDERLIKSIVGYVTDSGGNSKDGTG
jgi:hypothetical protein